MRRHRFIVPDIALSEDTIGIRDPQLAHQLRSVLRVRTGDEILISDGRGAEAVATVREYKEGAVVVAVQRPYALATEPPREVVVYAAVTKRDTFEWACQKATECGMTRLVPVISERTVKQSINLVRLRSIAREAAEQSGRAAVPEIGDITPLADALVAREERLLVASTADAPAFAREMVAGKASVALLIGPEGGFSDREIMEAIDAGWDPVSFGPRVLRAETAVAIGTYLVAK